MSGQSVGTDLVCVYAVVDQGPAYPAGVERKADLPVHCACDGRPAQEGAPVERQACVNVSALHGRSKGTAIHPRQTAANGSPAS